MKAFIVNLYWKQDHNVDNNVIMFSDTEEDAFNNYKLRCCAESMFPEHFIASAERAPWLDKPE